MLVWPLLVHSFHQSHFRKADTMWDFLSQKAFREVEQINVNWKFIPLKFYLKADFQFCKVLSHFVKILNAFLYIKSNNLIQKLNFV